VTDFSQYPSLETLTSRLLAGWPDHADYVEKSFVDRPPAVTATSEQIASCVLRLAEVTPGALDGLCDDYRFLCEKIVLPEELHFRRHNRYRLSKFSDALRECYDNAPFMARYMNGLLISNVVWNNHACAISSYAHDYLTSLRPGSDHLEIGPGHGLFLYFAATSPTVATVSGWDVSATSIEMTRKALSVLGISRPANLRLQNMFEASPEQSSDRFDSIVMSEILEHLEDPVAALKAAAAWLRPGGTIWVNVPANSPAPDHIFLVESPEHACDLVQAAGLEVTGSQGFPMTGATIEKARKRKLAISCVVVGRKH
jgi:2-polyprenyl-3-methyl-5-hydroxy-6-metoxy-1,4-benzoquinol methylase